MMMMMMMMMMMLMMFMMLMMMMMMMMVSMIMTLLCDHVQAQPQKIARGNSLPALSSTPSFVNLGRTRQGQKWLTTIRVDTLEAMKQMLLETIWTFWGGRFVSVPFQNLR